AAPAAASRAGTACRGIRIRRGGRRIRVGDAFGVGASVAFQLRLNPIERGPIAIGALPAISELRQTLDGGLVFLEIEPVDQRLDDRIRLRPRQRYDDGRLLILSSSDVRTTNYDAHGNAPPLPTHLQPSGNRVYITV